MSMKEIMNQELAEALATLNKANSALERIFNTEEGESMGTCMGCLKDFDNEDLVWQGGLLCESCKVE